MLPIRIIVLTSGIKAIVTGVPKDCANIPMFSLSTFFWHFTKDRIVSRSNLNLVRDV